MSQPTIDQVRAFWDANPLMTGEAQGEVGSREWFQAFDALRADVFLDDLEPWIGRRLIDGRRVLDLGCGPGYWRRQMARFGEPDYYGRDISPQTVALARRSAELFGLKGDIAAGNAEELEFASGFFDHVVCEGVIHHTPDTARAAREIMRVLKPGGTAAIGLYFRPLWQRSRTLFALASLVMRLAGVGLAGRGREKMAAAGDADNFVRMYDGADNPIGKAYTKAQARALFPGCASLRLSRYYFPARALPLGLPLGAQRWLSRRLGLMLLIELRK